MSIPEPQQRVTITMPADLLTYADRQARELNTSRSQIIAQALAAAKASHDEALAAEGYRFYASEAAEFAESSVHAVDDAWRASHRPVRANGAGDDGQTW